MLIKVCGMREPENIRAVCSLGVDYVGLIFAKRSPRYVPAECADAVCRAFDEVRGRGYAPQRVGVFVNSLVEEIVTVAERFTLDCIQLHGHEPIDMLPELRNALNRRLGRNLTLIKAVSVAGVEDVERCTDYRQVADMLLFDTKGKAAGGNGTRFDWSALEVYGDGPKFMLSGGISKDDAAEVARFTHPQMAGVDLNSRFETAPALKDIGALQTFINEIRNNEQQKTSLK